MRWGFAGSMRASAPNFFQQGSISDSDSMSLLNREVWGPALWTVLHSLAEKSGCFTNNVQILDEEVAWIGVFR